MRLCVEKNLPFNAAVLRAVRHVTPHPLIYSLTFLSFFISIYIERSFKMNSQSFAEALQAKFPDYEFYVEAGRKFDRIVQVYVKYGNSRQRSVHAFVEKSTGNLIKPAGWNAPAKWKSGWATQHNLLTDFERAIEAADFAGGYLYQS
jgi:hypothetical protein